MGRFLFRTAHNGRRIVVPDPQLRLDEVRKRAERSRPNCFHEAVVKTDKIEA